MSSEHIHVTPLTCAIRGFNDGHVDYVLRDPLGFLPAPHHFMGSHSAREAATQLLLDRNANLDGGSVYSRP